VKPLENSPEITDDRRAHQTFLVKAAALQRAVQGAVQAVAEIEIRSAHLQATLVQTPAAGEAERGMLRQLRTQLQDVKTALSGDATVISRNESAPMSIASRADNIYGPSVLSQAAVSPMLKQSYSIAASEFTEALEQLRALDAEMRKLENALDIKGAPWTPGRIPQWTDT
jgi:hypothetical protein